MSHNNLHVEVTSKQHFGNKVIVDVISYNEAIPE